MNEICTQCGHSKEDHEGYWSSGEKIPGDMCFWAENQGYSEDLCPCSGFNKEEPASYFETILGKAGL
jgi:hypothetical protein